MLNLCPHYLGSLNQVYRVFCRYFTDGVIFPAHTMCSYPKICHDRCKVLWLYQQELAFDDIRKFPWELCVLVTRACKIKARPLVAVTSSSQIPVPIYLLKKQTRAEECVSVHKSASCASMRTPSCTDKLLPLTFPLESVWTPRIQELWTDPSPQRRQTPGGPSLILDQRLSFLQRHLIYALKHLHKEMGIAACAGHPSIRCSEKGRSHKLMGQPDLPKQWVSNSVRDPVPRQ